MTQRRAIQWLTVKRGTAPLILSMPHTGVELPPHCARQLVSPWLARKDTDWWVDRLYDFAADLDATIVRTAISRTIIDANRDPSGQSLYPGQATTELCPTTTFDGEPVYRDGLVPDAAEIGQRRVTYFQPYHDALAAEIQRLRGNHANIVLYDCHSIRSRVPRLFEGVLPNFNLGTFNGAACAPQLAATIAVICDSTGLSRVTNGRFKGGYTTRHYGRPTQGVHAIQMELACRGYMFEPEPVMNEENWPTPYGGESTELLRATLRQILAACVSFAAAVP